MKTYEDVLPRIHRKTYLRTIDPKAKRVGLKARVKMHCLICMGGSKEEVRTCTAPACPFYVVRPYK